MNGLCRNLDILSTGPLSLRERVRMRAALATAPGVRVVRLSAAPTRAASQAAHPSSPCRPGFTLVELLVVIVIISMLAGLITVAAIKARQRVMNARMKIEVTLLSHALEAYKEGMGEYPPDFSDPNAVASHIARVFPQCTYFPGYLSATSLSTAGTLRSTPARRCTSGWPGRTATASAPIQRTRST